MKWLDNIVTTNTTNVVKGTFEVLYPKKGDEEYNKSKKDLLAKLEKVQGMCQSYSGNRMKIVPWRVQALKGAMEAHMGGGWYGHHREPRSLKFWEKGLKVGTQRYDRYKTLGWRTFLVT
jgi:hypothetical protein